MARTHDDLDRICASCNYGVRRVNGEIIKGPRGWKAKWIVNCPAMGSHNEKRCGRCRNSLKNFAYMQAIKDDFMFQEEEERSAAVRIYAESQGVEPYKARVPSHVIRGISMKNEEALKREIEDVELHIKDGDYQGHHQYWEEKL